MESLKWNITILRICKTNKERERKRMEQKEIERNGKKELEINQRTETLVKNI